MTPYPKGFVEWLANGHRGISANAIASHLSGIDCGGKSSFGNYPHDSADFLRCRKLLKAVPNFKERLHEMSEISPIWAALVEQWDIIDTTLAMEMNSRTDGTAPRTYKMMKDIIENGRKEAA